MPKKPGKQKHCRNALSFHSFKILIFLSLYSKWWLITRNISSQHANNIHDVFLHGALNVKTWFSHGVFWTGYKTNKQEQKTYPKKHTPEETNTTVPKKKWKEIWLYLQKELSRPKNVSWPENQKKICVNLWPALRFLLQLLELDLIFNSSLMWNSAFLGVCSGPAESS